LAQAAERAGFYGVCVDDHLDDEQFPQRSDRALAVNVTGAMNMVRAYLKDLVVSDSGRIVNVASTEALSSGRHTAPHTTSKHALLGFTRSPTTGGPV
jgi:3-oxoacyl-[acyl-carrier protein] reductase